MPMLQDHVEEALLSPREAGAPPPPVPRHPSTRPGLRSQRSEESIRTELCEGPVPDSPRPQTPEQEFTSPISDRAELIERLKRGESPTWVPNRHLESLFHQNRPLSPSRSARPPSRKNSPSPAPAITPEKKSASEEDADVEARLREGLEIERPRSALHSGDFTQNETSSRPDTDVRPPSRANGSSRFQPSTDDAWLATSPPRHYTPFSFQARTPYPARPDQPQSVPSSLSSSLSSSFVYKPPTSPLVQSESNEDQDLSLSMTHIDISPNGSSRNSRRHSLTSHKSSPYMYTTGLRNPSLRREGAYPYQAHQPRRSLNSGPHVSFPPSSPQTPAFLRSRRPSLGSDSSPIQHASMVGSYEESILRGRMSTTPSKPLDFLAQIGVLGLGRCKSSLRCPAHVTLPFSAVFYSYASTSHGRSRNEDGPSPYVGQIDLENGLPNGEDESRARRKMKSRHADLRREDDDVDMADRPAEGSEQDVRKAMKQKRRSGSPRAPPGGAYRIPEKGQIQIIIKNQNKTAVKLFLVPYDLAGMEPGTKTFIRQRSYSAGPIIDTVPGLKETGSGDRPILRYLIHLHICSPSRGRFYLYKSIRVVFANRVPDGKEKLQNEITLPEPRFTPYKPIRVMYLPLAQSSGPGAMLAAEQAFRRRSSGFSFGSHAVALGAMDGMLPPTLSRASSNPHTSSSSPGLSGANVPVDPIPFRLPRDRLQGRASGLGSDRAAAAASDDDDDDDDGDVVNMRSRTSSQTSRPTTTDSTGSLAWADGLDAQLARYDKLSKGDVGYGGNPYAQPANGSPGGMAEGLLSKRLRSLGVDQGTGQAESSERAEE